MSEEKVISSRDNISVKHLQESYDIRLAAIRENPADYIAKMDSLIHSHEVEVTNLRAENAVLQTKLDAILATVKLANISHEVTKNESDPARWVALGAPNKCSKCGDPTKWTWHDGLGNSIPKCRPTCAGPAVAGIPKVANQIMRMLEMEDDE